MDPVALAALGPMGIAMMAKKTVPAVMTVDGHLEKPVVEGAHVRLPKEMQLRVNLWRTDLLSGVLELDAHGNIIQAGIKDQPVYDPSLLLGFPPGMLQGVNLGAVLPLHSKHHLEALFTEVSG
jgi:hypothetical protein